MCVCVLRVFVFGLGAVGPSAAKKHGCHSATGVSMETSTGKGSFGARRGALGYYYRDTVIPMGNADEKHTNEVLQFA